VDARTGQTRRVCTYDVARCVVTNVSFSYHISLESYISHTYHRLGHPSHVSIQTLVSIVLSICTSSYDTTTNPGDVGGHIPRIHISQNAMSRSNSDNFGDIAAELPRPNKVPTEDEQLEKRDLNTTGLPEGVRDDEREIEKEATSSHKDDQTASTTRKRRSKGTETPEHLADGEDEKLKSLSFRDRLRSPLGSGLKLDELRETISNGVEIQYVLIPVFPRSNTQGRNADSQIRTTKDPPSSSTPNSGRSSLGTPPPNLFIRIPDDLLLPSNVVLDRTLYYLGHI
jgi:hypothetical protein